MENLIATIPDVFFSDVSQNSVVTGEIWYRALAYEAVSNTDSGWAADAIVKFDEDPYLFGEVPNADFPVAFGLYLLASVIENNFEVSAFDYLIEDPILGRSKKWRKRPKFLSIKHYLSPFQIGIFLDYLEYRIEKDVAQRFALELMRSELCGFVKAKGKPN